MSVADVEVNDDGSGRRGEAATSSRSLGGTGSARCDEAKLRALARDMADWHAALRPPTENELGEATTEALAVRIEANTHSRAAADAAFRLLQRVPEHFPLRVMKKRVRPGVANEADVPAAVVDLLAGTDAFDGRSRDVCEDLAVIWPSLCRSASVRAAETFLAAYAEHSQDYDFYPILDFYVHLRSAEDSRSVGASAEASADAGAELAQQRGSLAYPQRVFATGGSVCTGKSTTARGLAHALALARVNSDVARVAVLENPLLPTRHEADWERSFRPGFGEAVYAEVFRRAGAVLASGRSVVVDGCFGRRIHRDGARALARRFETGFLFVECQLPRSVHEQRLRERERERGDAEGDWSELLAEFERDWQPADEFEGDQHIVLSTEGSPEETSARLLQALSSPRPPGGGASSAPESLASTSSSPASSGSASAAIASAGLESPSPESPAPAISDLASPGPRPPIAAAPDLASPRLTSPDLTTPGSTSPDRAARDERKPRTSLRVQLLRAVTFDCWNTLLEELTPERSYERRVALLRETAEAEGQTVDAYRARSALDAAWRRHWQAWQEVRSTGSQEIASWALQALEVDSPSAADELASAFENVSLTSDVRVLEGSEETLRRVAERGIATALICDTGFTPGRVVRELLDRAGLLRWLQVLTFSDEVGLPKPGPLPFVRTLERLAIDPERSLHVGDSRRTDVAGARAAGMLSVRIHQSFDDRSGLPEADRVVSDHRELARLLGRFESSREFAKVREA